MAGAGYKLFNTGDVLTAQQVNEYLQQQTVMVFANSTARTTALSGVLAEGMMSYLQDTNALAKYDGSSWVTIDLPSQTGNAGKYLTTNGTTPSWATVNSGNVFTNRLTVASTNFTQIAYNGTNLYVAVGISGLLYTSPDAITWTARTSGFGANNINDVAFGNGLWVAVGGNGTITTSTDGITWTARTSNMGTNDIRAITYANSLWVAVGAGGGTTNTGGITYSSDGLTWTRKSQSLTVGATYRTVVWNGTNWIVGANLSTNNYLYASTPSGTWTAGVTVGGGNVYKIIWDGTRHTINEGSFYYTTSTTLASAIAQTTHSANTNAIAGNVSYYNGKIYVAYNSRVASFTPSSSATPTNDPYFLAPGVLNGATVTDATCIYVGAIGTIIGTDYGIFTSF